MDLKNASREKPLRIGGYTVSVPRSLMRKETQRYGPVEALMAVVEEMRVRLSKLKTSTNSGPESVVLKERIFGALCCLK